MLALALGLGALVWSCESEQTGYDVTLPLIGPMEFDETSCEISGDVCSTDDDCVDEDGFNVGPCTMTLTPIEAITVSLSPSNPSYTLPAFETARWLAPLAVLQNTDTNPIALTTENFQITGGPITLSVRPFSQNGLILGRDANYEPNDLQGAGEPCRFTLDDSATGQDYSDGITACLSAWVKENGAPLEFDIEVTSSAGGAPSASASARSGFGLKQESYTINADDTWSTDQACPGQSSDDVLDAVAEGNDFFSLIDCNERLEFEGGGKTDREISISGVATVYDKCGNQLSTAKLGSAVNDIVLVGPPTPTTPPPPPRSRFKSSPKMSSWSPMSCQSRSREVRRSS